MSRVFRLFVLTLLGVLLPVLGGMADLSMPSIFGDHMVLQAGKGAPVWGWATPGSVVNLTLGEQPYQGLADVKGRWEIVLPPQEAQGEGVELAVEGDGETLRFTDVLFGEVWIGSGQSNMDMTVGRSKDAEAEIASAGYPLIHLFMVERAVAERPQRDCVGEWVLCSPETVGGFSATAYYFGRELHQRLGVPVGLIKTAWGGTPVESWTSAESLAGEWAAQPLAARWKEILVAYPDAQKKHEAALAQWEAKKARAKRKGRKASRAPREPMGPEHPHRPSSLFNAMVAPLIPYAMQGVIWYQGEANSRRAYQYRRLFPLMISDWRAAWGQGVFPFYFVLLANYRDRSATPGEFTWAELREAQLRALHLPATGVASALDIGEAKDIHPKNKQEVGRRLALNALAQVYGKAVVYSGPVYRELHYEGDRLVVHFDHCDGGLVAKEGGALSGFAVAGADQKFVWAEARIEGDTVVLRAEGVAHPVAVRYAWQDNPASTLYNGAGLPASPFRTDDWPGLTVEAY